MNKNSSREMLDLQGETKFCFPKIFNLKSFFKYFVVLMNYSRVLTRFKSSTYIAIIANLVSDFSIKMHGHIGLFAYPSFNKYSLRRLDHMILDSFNPYRDHCNLIEHILQGFVLFASSNLGPLRIFIYICHHLWI